jgi:hypothetical protein
VFSSCLVRVNHIKYNGKTSPSDGTLRIFRVILFFVLRIFVLNLSIAPQSPTARLLPVTGWPVIASAAAMNLVTAQICHSPLSLVIGNIYNASHLATSVCSNKQHTTHCTQPIELCSNSYITHSRSDYANINKPRNITTQSLKLFSWTP